MHIVILHHGAAKMQDVCVCVRVHTHSKTESGLKVSFRN